MEDVGLRDVEELYNSYPHELSGGMRQRIMIAMALIANPKMLIADEPTTALDATIQAQILRLFNRMKEAYEGSIIFISHDLEVVASICHRVIVMYAGRIVEIGSADELLNHLCHPYTFGLLRAIPSYNETDLVTGRHLTKIPQAVCEVVAGLARKPAVVMICITCVDALLGTDMERVCRKAEAAYSDRKSVV